MSTLLMQEVEEPPAWEQVQALAHHQAPARVDQVVARLFPIPTVGQLFYTRFRERASREQTTLPDEPADTVVICTKSIATLAQELGIGFDTTQKYVALYKALGLLKKRKVMGKLAFIMGAGIYHPPECLEANLQHLLKIIKGRHKFRELVSDVLARCRVYGLITQDFQAAAALLQDLLQPQQGETRRTLEQRLLQAGQVFNQVLSSMHLPKTGGQEDAQWFHFSGIVEAEESPQAKTSGRHNESDRKLPRPAHRVDSSALHQSPQAAQSGGFGQEDPAQNLPHLLHRIDSASSRPEDEATHTHAQGRFEGEAPVRNLPDPPHQIDSARPQTVDEATHTHVQSRFEGETPVSRPPTSAHRVDSSATSPIKRTVESTQPDQRDRFGQEAAASNPPNPTAQVDSQRPYKR